MRLLGFFFKPSVSELCDALSHYSRAVRRRAICALEKIGHDIREGGDILLQCRGDDDPFIRSKVALLLPEALPPQQFLPALLDMLFDEDQVVREAATMSLLLQDCTYKGSDKQLKELRKLLLAYAVVIHSDDEYKRIQTAIQLSSLARKMEGPGAVYVLVGALRNRPGGASAAIRLGEIGKKATLSVPFLIDLLRDPDPSVRDCAANSLKQITNKRFGENFKRWSAWAKKEWQPNLEEIGAQVAMPSRRKKAKSGGGAKSKSCASAVG